MLFTKNKKYLQLKVHKIANVKLPSKGTKDSACFDFFIPEYSDNLLQTLTLQKDIKANKDSITINPHSSILIPSGLKVSFPHGYCLKLENKSGIASKNKLLKGACVIDSDYHQEIFYNLHNVSSKPIILTYGQKIIQGNLQKVEDVQIVEYLTEEVLYQDRETTRKGGFGSTGLMK